jgi:hypothetical protein
MEYNFRKIEADWQKYWAENQTFKAENPALSGVEGKSKWSALFSGLGGDSSLYYYLIENYCLKTVFYN